jgi:hypothetical protein
MTRGRRGGTDPTLSGRIGAFRLHALYDPRQTTGNARKAFLDSFERQVDAHRLLPEDERRRRAGLVRFPYTPFRLAPPVATTYSV